MFDDDVVDQAGLADEGGDGEEYPTLDRGDRRERLIVDRFDVIDPDERLGFERRA